MPSPNTVSGAARAAVEDLLARAAYALDEREDAMLAACFAEDAVFTLRIADGDLVGPFEGRDAIMSLMRGAWEQQTDVRRHVVSNVFFSTEGETGDDALKVTSYLTLVATENGKISLISAGVYRDEVVFDGARWQLSRRHLDLDRPY